MWRSVGFLMNFGAVMELATLVAFAVVLLGGRQMREGGWKIIAGLLGFVSVVEAAGIGMIVSLSAVAPRGRREEEEEEGHWWS